MDTTLIIFIKKINKYVCCYVRVCFYFIVEYEMKKKMVEKHFIKKILIKKNMMEFFLYIFIFCMLSLWMNIKNVFQQQQQNVFNGTVTLSFCKWFYVFFYVFFVIFFILLKESSTHANTEI